MRGKHEEGLKNQQSQNKDEKLGLKFLKLFNLILKGRVSKREMPDFNLISLIKILFGMGVTWMTWMKWVSALEER